MRRLKHCVRTTRRHFFGQRAVRLGSIAINCLLAGEGLSVHEATRDKLSIIATKPGSLRF